MNNKYMELAYKEALKAYKKGEVPLVQLLFVIIVVAKAHNLRESKQIFHGHAEFLAMQKQ